MNCSQYNPDNLFGSVFQTCDILVLYHVNLHVCSRIILSRSVSKAPRPKRPGPPSFSSSEDEGEDDEEENAPPVAGGNKNAHTQKNTSKNSNRTDTEPLKTSRRSTEVEENTVDPAANRKKEHDKTNESLAKGTRKTRASLAREENLDDSVANRTRGSISEGGNPNDSIASRTRRSKGGATPSEPANQGRARRRSSTRKK